MYRADVVTLVIAVLLFVQCMHVRAQCDSNPLVIIQDAAKSSYIQSPNYPLNYTENTICEWKIKAKSKAYDEDFLKFEVVHFVLMGNSGCTSDYLEIVAETRSADPEQVVKKSVGRWCGKRYSKYMEIPGDVTVTFRSDGSLTSTGFKIKIDLVKVSDVCASTVRLNTTAPIYGSHIEAVQEFGPSDGYIYSPGYPFGLYREMTCVWEVGITQAKYLSSGTLHLENSIQELQTIPSSSATSPGDIHIKEDWEGGKEYRYRIDEYFFYRSSSDYHMDQTVTITFNRTSHGPKYQPGFRLIMYPRMPYKSGCYMDVLTADPDPSFVDQRDIGYEYDFARCSWMISSGISIGGDASRVVVLELLVMDFDWSSVDSCNKVFTVEDQNHTLLYDHECQTKTKSDMPVLIRSYGVRVFVKFNIDTKLNRLLFKYYSRNRYDYSENPLEAVDNQSYMWMVAPSILKEWITEPVRWLFTTRRPGECIEVRIVNMVGSNHQTRQYFRVFDGIDESGDEIMTCPYQGQKPWTGVVSSTGSSLLVVINTDRSPLDEPFLLTYSATDNCGTDIMELAPASSSVQTVKVDIIKPHKNILCRWKIPAEGFQFEITSSTQLVPTSCVDNFLAAYSSLSPERMIGKWCSSNASVISSGNYTYLKLKVEEITSGHFQADYFLIEKSSSCCTPPSVIQLTSGSDFILSSANHPAFYPMNCDCTWHIRAANPRQVISVQVEDFDLQTVPSGGKCVDSLALYNGNDRKEANLITVLCGHGGNGKQTFVTKEQNVTLHFTTDSQISAPGFKLRFTSISASYTNTEWNTELNVQTQSMYIIYSGPSDRCSGICTWVLISPEDHVTHIEVIHLQIPCTAQYLEIVDMTDSQNHPSYGKLCGGTSARVTSLGTKFNISFHVGGPDTHIVLRIKYFSEPMFAENTCNNRIMKLNALHDIAKIIRSPNNPQHYTNNLQCQWLLHTEGEGMVIKLVSSQSHIELTDNCMGDYIEVYDGQNASSARLGRWCGVDAPVYHSSGNSMLVVFRTDFAIGDAGFTISYMAIEKPQSGLSSSMIYVIILAVLLVVIIICASIWISRRKKHRGRHRSPPDIQYKTAVS